MTDHEREVVQRVLAHAGQEVRGAQRCVEVLANLFEAIRFELYPEQASRIWYVLNQIPNLRRMPLYPPAKGEERIIASSDHYRWFFEESAFHAWDLRRLSDSVEELNQMLSGVKIEDVAQSKGHERHEQFIRQMASIPLDKAKIAAKTNRVEDEIAAIEPINLKT